MFDMYCYTQEGKCVLRVPCITANRAVYTAMSISKTYHKIILVDEDDYVVLHIEGGSLVFPVLDGSSKVS